MLVDSKKLATWAKEGDTSDDPYAVPEEEEVLYGPLGDQAGELLYLLVDYPEAASAGVSGEEVDPDLLEDIKELLVGLSDIHFRTIAGILYYGGDGVLEPGLYMNATPVLAESTPQDVIDWLKSLAGEG